VLDPANTASPVLADTAYRSAADIEALRKCGLKPQFQRPKPREKPMPCHVACGNAKRARIRSRVENVSAAQKCCFALVIRAVDKARATAKSALANLTHNPTSFLWLETRQAA
jgi:IS5 family transposase